MAQTSGYKSQRPPLCLGDANSSTGPAFEIGSGGGGGEGGDGESVDATWDRHLKLVAEVYRRPTFEIRPSMKSYE